MKFHHSYILSAEKIIKGFDGSLPFAQFLKQFFSANKKFGSRDRKAIANICYEYYRLGCAGNHLSFREKVSAAHFLCNSVTDEPMQDLNPAWVDKIHLPLPDKLSLLSISPMDIFPFANHLTLKINREAFIRSLLLKPDTFLRIRPGRQRPILQKLAAAGVAYTLEDNNAIRLEGNPNLDDIIALNKEAVVQDLSSQQVLDYLDHYDAPASAAVWDCCAASGGKAILAYDKLGGKIKLTLSDIRPSILQNLKGRLARAGVPIYHLFSENLEQSQDLIQGQPFDIIICDVPCTGSGTWGRTPEQVSFFNESTITDYVQRQQKIADNALHNLKKGGVLFYITCSVFEAENEGVVNFLKRECLQMVSMEYIKGYGQKADTMFVAVLRKDT